MGELNECSEFNAGVWAKSPPLYLVVTVFFADCDGSNNIRTDARLRIALERFQSVHEKHSHRIVMPKSLEQNEFSYRRTQISFHVKKSEAILKQLRGWG